jgi:serine/threonine protein kinase
MICPRCGNQWDAMKGACTRCGLVIPMADQFGSLPRFPNSREKNTTRNIPLGREQGTLQTRMAGPGSLSLKSGAQPGALPLLANRSIDFSQQEMSRPQMPSPPPPQAQAFTHQVPSAPLAGDLPNQQRSQPSASSPQDSTSTASLKARPLLPGVLLRGVRYRLEELQERQDWLFGTFEAGWRGKDFPRAGSEVMIREVVLPEQTSVIAQTLLRTATMTLASVGRYPQIPALWDAFSDRGRSFFVFEPIVGESLLTRMRANGGPLPEQEVIACCLQMTDVLELLAQQSPQVVHGWIRPEHIVLSRESSHYVLTTFSIVLAGGGTQYISGIERSRLSPYTAPEFVHGVVDVRTDLYSLLASAYYAVTGSVPTASGRTISQAQRINPNLSSAFDAILGKGLQEIASKRYQRPAELRQDLLAMRSVNGALISSNGSNSLREKSIPSLGSRTGQQAPLPTERIPDNAAQVLPGLLNLTEEVEERVKLLPRPEELPPMKEANDSLSTAIWLCAILLSLIVLVALSHLPL